MQSHEVNTYIRENYLDNTDERLVQELFEKGYPITVGAVRKRRETMGLRKGGTWVADRNTIKPVQTDDQTIHYKNRTKVLTEKVEQLESVLNRPKHKKRELLPAVEDVKGVRSMIVLPDMQTPYHDPKALAVVEKYMANHKWDIYLNLGDFMDFDCISDFNKNKPRLVEGKRLYRDYDIANEVLDRHQAIIRKKNPKARFVLLEGNHEERMVRYLDSFPQLEGLFEVPIGLRLEERGFEWIESWSAGKVFTVGHANFIHGQYINRYHASKMVDTYSEPIFYGHTHDMMCFPKLLKAQGKIIVGQSLGCLCEYNQSYMKGKPSNWQQGFGVFYFLPNGNFTYYTPRIIDHQFIGPDGIHYHL